MDKQETYRFLDSRGIRYEVTEHKAVFTMGELADAELPYPGSNAKNLFVRDDKKRRYYLITVRGDARVDLKEFRARYGTRALSFASADDLRAILKLEPGSVTPLGLLNDDERRVAFYMDASFLEGDCRIGCHPNDNTATVWLDGRDLLGIVRAHGNETHVMER